MASKYQGERRREDQKFRHGTALGYSFDQKDEDKAYEIAMAAIAGDVDILKSVPANIVMNVKSALKSEGFAALAKLVQSSDPISETVREIITKNNINEQQLRSVIKEILIHEGVFDDVWSGIKSGAGKAFDFISPTFGADKPTSGFLKTLDDLSSDETSITQNAISLIKSRGSQLRALVAGDSQAGSALGNEIKNLLVGRGFSVIINSKPGVAGNEIASFVVDSIKNYDLAVVIWGGNDSSPNFAATAFEKMYASSTDSGTFLIAIGPPPATRITDIDLAKQVFGDKIESPEYFIHRDDGVYAQRRIDIAAAIEKAAYGKSLAAGYGIAANLRPGIDYPEQPDGIHCNLGASDVADEIFEVIGIDQIVEEIKQLKQDAATSANGENSEMIPFDYDQWSNEIAAIESRGSGNYSAINKDTFALGKYQFVPRYWWDEIKAFAVTQGIELSGEPMRGVRLPAYQEFLNNPSLQEKWMQHYTETYAVPAIKRLRSNLPEETARISDGKLAALYHFQGERGASDWLLKGIMQGRDINSIDPGGYMSRVT